MGLELTDTESGALQRRGIDEGQFRKSVVVNAPVNISISGGDPEKVKKAVVDGVSHALAPAGHVGLLDTKVAPIDTELIVCVRQAPTQARSAPGDERAGDVEINTETGTEADGVRWIKSSWQPR